PDTALAETARQSHGREAPGARADPVRAPYALRRGHRRRPPYRRTVAAHALCSLPCALCPLPGALMRVTVLGSGTSHGVPSIGCDCDVCKSPDPKDHRTRPSIFIEVTEGAAPFSILVDTSTDLRTQALAN